MLLKSKVSLILLAVFVLLLGFYHVIQRLVIFQSFVVLEREDAKKNMERCVEALQREIHHLDLLANDWAAWDDTYKFVKDRNNDYVKACLVPETFTNDQLNLLYICNEKGEVAWGEVRDLKTMDKIQLHDFPLKTFPQTHPLFVLENSKGPIAGCFLTERGPMLVASRPILTSKNEGPSRGFLIMGRLLDANAVKILREQARVDFQLWPIKGNFIPLEERGVLNQITRKDPLLIKELRDDRLQIYTTFSDILGAPALLIRADISRDITQHGKSAIFFATFSIIAAGLATFIVIWILLKRIVTEPISILTNHIITIGKTDDLSSRLSFKRGD